VTHPRTERCWRIGAPADLKNGVCTERRNVSVRDSAWARRYVWAAMASTLDNDLHMNGADYIFEDADHDGADRRRIVRATEQVLKTMRRRALTGSRK